MGFELLLNLLRNPFRVFLLFLAYSLLFGKRDIIAEHILQLPRLEEIELG